MKPLRLLLLGVGLALFASACVAPPPNSWPGLSANDELAFVAYNHQVIAVNLSDGKQRWAFPPSPGGELFFAEPGVSDEIIVVGSEGTLGQFHGALFGLDPANGAQKWCLALDSRARDRLTTPTAPCPLIPGGDEATFFGLIMPPVDNRVIGGIVVRDGVAYVGLANNRVIAVDALTGELRWARDLSQHPIWTAPLVDDTSVYVASLDHKLYALARSDGAKKWEVDLGASLGGTPALQDGVLYVGTFGDKVAALRAQDGRELWRAEATNWVWGGPAVRDGVVYFADLNGTVFALNAQNGRELWRQTPGGKIRSTPALLNDLLFIGDRDSNLFALNVADGALQWTQSIPGGGHIYTTPLVMPERDLVISAVYQGSNLLVAYTPGGAFKWAFAPSQ